MIRVGGYGFNYRVGRAPIFSFSIVQKFSLFFEALIRAGGWFSVAGRAAL
jgi:hypothetical protein